MSRVIEIDFGGGYGIDVVACTWLVLELGEVGGSGRVSVLRRRPSLDKPRSDVKVWRIELTAWRDSDVSLWKSSSSARREPKRKISKIE